MLLCQPSVFFQSVLDIIRIKLCKGFKVHIKVSRILQLEFPFPLLRHLIYTDKYVVHITPPFLLSVFA